LIIAILLAAWVLVVLSLIGVIYSGLRRLKSGSWSGVPLQLGVFSVAVFLIATVAGILVGLNGAPSN
jgi:hypothetical protein